MQKKGPRNLGERKRMVMRGGGGCGEGMLPGGVVLSEGSREQAESSVLRAFKGGDFRGGQGVICQCTWSSRSLGVA